MSKPSLTRVHLKSLARALPSVDAHLVTIPAQRAQPRREALLQMNFRDVHIQPPLHGACLRPTEICAWVVRAWEPQPPEGQEPLEWILLTTLPITCGSSVWEVVQWYGWRWLLEDFHKVLLLRWLERYREKMLKETLPKRRKRSERKAV